MIIMHAPGGKKCHFVVSMAAILYMAAILVFKNVINGFLTLGNPLVEPKVDKIGQTRAEISILAFFNFSGGGAYL